MLQHCCLLKSSKGSLVLAIQREHSTLLFRSHTENPTTQALQQQVLPPPPASGTDGFRTVLFVTLPLAPPIYCLILALIYWVNTSCPHCFCSESRVKMLRWSLLIPLTCFSQHQWGERDCRFCLCDSPLSEVREKRWIQSCTCAGWGGSCWKVTKLQAPELQAAGGPQAPKLILPLPQCWIFFTAQHRLNLEIDKKASGSLKYWFLLLPRAAEALVQWWGDERCVGEKATRWEEQCTQLCVVDGSFSVDLIYPWSNYGTSFLIEITLSEKLCNWPCICGLKVAQEEQDGDVQHANGSSGETETKTAQNLVTDLQFLSPPPFIFFFPVSFPYPTFFLLKKVYGAYISTILCLLPVNPFVLMI